ncbi:MAG TPA: NAD(P)/FAD-dependent oxidoreductase [Roseiflexaceae bacterium]|nr:NAD(P)/FAD-dependent oxidoreductase [Roseiflexaceae bacterium]
MTSYDAIFIGSGHNALVAAAYLARAGWSVLVLEKHDRPGGLVRTEELTLPGFRHDVYSSAHPLFLTSSAYADLGQELEQRGLRYLNTDLPTGVMTADGQTAVFSRDMSANVAEGERLAPGDGTALAQLFEEFNAHAPNIFRLFSLDLAAPEARQLISELMSGPGHTFSPFAADFLLTARDMLYERFQSPVFHAMAGPWVLHLGRVPDGANSAFWVPLTLMALMGGGMPTPEGGSEMLARSLARLITDNGGVIRTGAAVERILVKSHQATGVRTADGEVYEARRAVVASTNPDQLYLRLLADADIDAPIRRQAGRFRYGRGCMQVQLALAEKPRWNDPRFDRVGQPHISNGLEGCALHVVEALNGLLPAAPTFTVDVPTNLDPSRAPVGRAIMRIQALEVPCRIRGDAAGQIDAGDGTWSADVARRFAERLLDLVAPHAPNLRDSILGMHIVTPDDLARFSPNQGPGDAYGGSHDIAQSYLLRPLPGQPAHRTVVPNVYMLGAATWPGHGINGGSGYIVAQELLGR